MSPTHVTSSTDMELLLDFSSCDVMGMILAGLHDNE